jgi:membrane-bound serine protease (ClpP class)
MGGRSASRAVRAAALVWMLAAVRAAPAPARNDARPEATAPADPNRPAAPQAPARAKRSRPPAQPGNVFIIPIREPISAKTHDALERKLVRALAQGADLLIFDMDTWGGQAGAALEITRLIKTDLVDVHTVCLVRTRAVSAGAMIAVACDEIVMTGVGKLGDCAPILTRGKLEGVEREKTETVLRTEFGESARLNGYPIALAKSMVSYGLEVWLVRNRDSGERRYILRHEWEELIGVQPDDSPEAAEAAAAASPWQRVKKVVREGELLTMDTADAVAYGFASAVVKAPGDAPYRALLERYDVRGAPTILRDTWSEDLVDFLRSPLMMGLLLFLAMLFGYVEMHTPGFGVFGGLAIVCFALLLGSNYLVGLARWWEIALIVLGVLLLALEVLVIPGFGVAGISGILCCLAGLAGVLLANPPGELPIPETALDWRMLRRGALAFGVALAAATAAAALLSKVLPKIPLASRIVLAPAAPAGGSAPAAERSPIHRIQVGDVGLVEGTCRPVGKVRFGDDLLDAVSDGEMIPAGARARVLRRDGNRLVVEQTEGE